METNFARAVVDSFKWHMEMQNKNWLTTEQFKKAMRNKKLREKIGFEVTNCAGCRKIIALWMSFFSSVPLY